MVKVIAFLFALSSIQYVNAQITRQANVTFTKIGEINRSRVPGAVPDAILEYSIQYVDSIKANDTMYALRFDDMTPQSPIFSSKEPSRHTVYFSGKGNTLAQFYELLSNVFTDKQYDKPGLKTIITLGQQTVTISRDPYADKPRIHLMLENALLRIRNEKELNWLFGKPKK